MSNDLEEVHIRHRYNIWNLWGVMLIHFDGENEILKKMVCTNQKAFNFKINEMCVIINAQHSFVI